MKAIKLDEGKDVTIIQLPNEVSINISSIVGNDNRKIISFGLMPNRIGLNASFSANHMYPTETFSVLLTHSLAKLESDKGKKMALWTALQSTFK